jgi:biotin transport system substrate-specific component
MNADTRNKVYPLAMTAVMAAVLCVLGPISVPIGPIPISLTTLAIYFTLFLLGWKRSTLCCLVYLLIGLVGMPVFSGYSGGLGKLMGPTGGYIIGFLPMALIAGLCIDKFRNPVLRFLGLVVGTAVCYALGTAWFCFQSGAQLSYAVGVCVLPFIPFDLLKMLLAVVVGPILRTRLEQAGLHPAA